MGRGARRSQGWQWEGRAVPAWWSLFLSERWREVVRGIARGAEGWPGGWSKAGWGVGCLGGPEHPCVGSSSGLRGTASHLVGDPSLPSGRTCWAPGAGTSLLKLGPGGEETLKGILQVPSCQCRSKGLRRCGTRSRRLSEGDAVLIQRQQQQDSPAAQQAHVVQQEQEPRPLVLHPEHGRELRR